MGINFTDFVVLNHHKDLNSKVCYAYILILQSMVYTLPFKLLIFDVQKHVQWMVYQYIILHRYSWDRG